MVVHGIESTGKTLTIKKVLSCLPTPSTVIRCRECVTTRHLLEGTVAQAKVAVREASEGDLRSEIDGRCESVSVFAVRLQQILKDVEQSIIVFDRIDRQREPTPLLLQALARLSESVSDHLHATRVADSTKFRSPASLSFSS